MSKKCKLGRKFFLSQVRTFRKIVLDTFYEAQQRRTCKKWKIYSTYLILMVMDPSHRNHLAIIWNAFKCDEATKWRPCPCSVLFFRQPLCWKTFPNKYSIREIGESPNFESLWRVWVTQSQKSNQLRFSNFMTTFSIDNTELTVVVETLDPTKTV